LRIKDPEDRSSIKARLGSDAAVLAVLLRNQPIEKRELITKAGISDSGFSRVEPLLLVEKLIKIIDGKYVLFNYENLDVDMEEIFKKFKNENKTEVRLEVLANMTGKPPEKIRDKAYSLAKKYNMHIYYE
jgi:hypothetical protein